MSALTQEQVSEMYRLQNKLNNDTNGAAWAKTKVTKEGRKINWLRCIYMETAEAIDSLNWKHWKDINAKDDMDNLKVELVDIWHFIMSEHITRVGIDAAIRQTSEILEHIAHEPALFYDEHDLFYFLEALMRQTVNGALALLEFLQSVQKLDGFTMQDVYRLYIGKNCLNSFRQDHGYKEGTYQKVWNGKEDNVYMQEIINQDETVSFDTLYTQLEAIYSSL